MNDPKAVVSIAVLFAACGSAETFSTRATVEDQIESAATRFHVPPDILKAHAWTVSRFTMPPLEDDGHGHAITSVGIMGLVPGETLELAAKLTLTEVDVLATDATANINAGAALMSHFAAQHNGDWWAAVGDFSGSASEIAATRHARGVYRNFKGAAWTHRGLPADLWSPAAGGDPKRDADPNWTTLAALSSDYPLALVDLADPGNYTVGSRSSTDINYVVIHTTQGSYSSAINWFQNPQSQVSAHYIIRSSDGEITQSVPESDVAWHAGNYTYNSEGIGIEHEGWVNDPAWYTDAMYESSAKLTRYLCDKYNIPIDRTHILGHMEVPGTTKGDPGQYWDWSRYLDLVNRAGVAGAKLVGFVRAGDIYQGTAIAGAKVTLDAGSTASTDSNGYYAFDQVTSGTHTIKISKSGYATRTVTKDVANSSGTHWKSVALQ